MGSVVKTAESIYENGLMAAALFGAALMFALMFIAMPIFIVGYIAALAFVIHPILGSVVGAAGLMFLVSAGFTTVRRSLEY